MTFSASSEPEAIGRIQIDLDWEKEEQRELDEYRIIVDTSVWIDFFNHPQSPLTLF